MSFKEFYNSVKNDDYLSEVDNDHYKVICEKCEKIIKQCRCNEDNKKVTYEICEKCKDHGHKEKELMNEEHSGNKFEKALHNLINDVKKGKGLDPRMKDVPDGEILAMILTPIFQTHLMMLKDKKSFKKNFDI